MKQASLFAGTVAAGAFALLAFAQTEISWWRAMTGANAEVVQKIADDFNASQSDYKVVPAFKGTYPHMTVADNRGYAHGRLTAVAPESLVVRVPGHLDLHPGRPIHVVPNRDMLHLFEPETGKRL